MPDFNESIDRVVAGPERKSRIMNDQVRERIAYHEVGHAVVGELLPNANPVHKVTSCRVAVRWATPCRCRPRTST